MTSRKKNTITLIILSVVLLICLLLYFLMPDRKKEEADGDKDNGQITVDTIAADTIETISFEKDGKTVWSLKRSKENWKMAEDDSIPVNEETPSIPLLRRKKWKPYPADWKITVLKRLL